MAKNSEKSPNIDEVGYARPPKLTQFKKGQSGNPKGRPKTVKSVSTMLTKIFQTKVKVTSGGKTQWMTRMELSLMQLATKSASGDHRALKLLMDITKQYPIEEKNNQLDQLMAVLQEGGVPRGHFNDNDDNNDNGPEKA